MEISIEEKKENVPLDLLLLADPSEDLIREYLRDGIVFTARVEKEIIGVLVLLRTRPKTMEIMNVAVKENHQNRGIGRELLLNAIAYAREHGITAVDIGTGNPGVVQMLLYQKCGFRIVGVEPDYFRKNYAERIFENGIECRDMVRMRREI